MKGVVLAGGSGTRLRPVTSVLNKHIIPVYDLPMIHYPVNTLVKSGIDEILIISNAEHLGKYVQLVEDEFDANFQYKVQSEAKGIAHAVSLAEGFVEDEFTVILGDNILIGDVTEEISSFNGGAKIFVTGVDDPAAYGVASVNDGKVTKLTEKPGTPESDLAAIGLYIYTSDVFDVISDLEPSDRGEYEITDVNKHYIDQSSLNYSVFDGDWFDAGTPEGLFKAAECIRKLRQSDGES
jgi:glucose-1-phosphate thymidylyltransferase